MSKNPVTLAEVLKIDNQKIRLIKWTDLKYDCQLSNHNRQLQNDRKEVAHIMLMISQIKLSWVSVMVSKNQIDIKKVIKH